MSEAGNDPAYWWPDGHPPTDGDGAAGESPPQDQTPAGAPTGNADPLDPDGFVPDGFDPDAYMPEPDGISAAPAEPPPPDDTSTGTADDEQREPLHIRVLRTLRSTLSALHGATPQAALQLLQRIESSERVLGALRDEERDRTLVVLEVLTHEASVLTTGLIDLGDLPVAAEYQPHIQSELARIAQEVGVSTPGDPHAAWSDLVEIVQRSVARNAAYNLVRSIEEREPVAELMERFRKLEPPTSKKAVSRERTIKTAREVSEAVRASRAGRQPLRFSSGLPTLDAGYTGVDEPKGFVSPGTFTVVMGPTGTGKTSFSYSITPALGMDLVNWGLKDAKQVFFHTEEETIDKLKGCRMDIGQKYHHLADNLVIDAVGTSRTRMLETLYDLVIDADEQARYTKRPITDFLPYVVQLDYIQSIQEGSEDMTTASAVTAEFLLRGVCAWNPEEMAKFGGVQFREYAGMAWPAGMEQHRVAVIGYAQLVKTDDETNTFKEGKRGIQLSDFAILDDKDDPMWDVREGDLRLFGKNQMRGSGIIAQNSHAIVILHRSVPHNNPAFTDADGNLHLTDTRARILFEKTRAGSRLPYAPMRFDVQANGFRAQYFDELAERAMAAGKLTDVDPSYTDVGDPVLPVRPVSDPLGECRY